MGYRMNAHARITLLLLIITPVLTGCAGSSSESVQVVSQESVMPLYPSPATWEYANERQRQRAQRSFDQLRKHKMPAFSGPLFVADEEAVKLQSPQDVARRTLVLWAVELRAEGTPQAEALGLIKQLDLWGSVSSAERRFLEDENPDPEECQELVWRLESIWVLLWALGYLEELAWPESMCDVRRIVNILKEHESNPEFISKAKLRSSAEILDAQDLIMRIHWAIRDAYLNRNGMIPKRLDWNNSGEMEHVTEAASVGVVEQRHYTLNWLVMFLDNENWDDVDTPT
jgi:hypothetical protein